MHTMTTAAIVGRTVELLELRAALESIQGRDVVLYFSGHGDISGRVFDMFPSPRHEHLVFESFGRDHVIRFDVCQARQVRPDSEVDLLPDRLTDLERRAGVDSAPSSLEADRRQRPGRINRLFRAALTATRAVPGSRRLAEVFRIMLRRIARAIGRLLSLVLGEVDAPDPPGQLLTAQPHVTRGPTPVRAVTVLSALRRPALG